VGEGPEVLVLRKLAHGVVRAGEADSGDDDRAEADEADQPVVDPGQLRNALLLFGCSGRSWGICGRTLVVTHVGLQTQRLGPWWCVLTTGVPSCQVSSVGLL